MTTVYPAQIDNIQSLPLVISGVTSFTSDSINTPRAAIIAIETTLGVNPATIYGTVRARLDAMEKTINNIVGGGSQAGIQLAGDIGGTLINPLVIGLRGVPIATSTATPSSGNMLVFNGTSWTASDNIGSANFVTTGQITSGPILATSIDTGFVINNGKFIFNAITAPAVSDPGQAIMYYDQSTNQLLISQNGNAYFNFDTTTPITHLVSNTNYVVSEISNDVFIGMSGLTANRTITLPSTPGTGMRVYVKDRDGSLASFNIIVAGNGNTIDGASDFTMTSIAPGIKGAIILWFDGSGWSIV